MADMANLKTNTMTNLWCQGTFVYWTNANIVLLHFHKTVGRRCPGRCKQNNIGIAFSPPNCVHAFFFALLQCFCQIWLNPMLSLSYHIIKVSISMIIYITIINNIFNMFQACGRLCIVIWLQYIFDAMLSQLHRARLLPQWRIYFMNTIKVVSIYCCV